MALAEVLAEALALEMQALVIQEVLADSSAKEVPVSFRTVEEPALPEVVPLLPDPSVAPRVAAVPEVLMESLAKKVPASF